MKNLYIALALLLSASASVPTAEAASNWGKYRIMIDPGHGGSDPGASGPSAPHEAELALRCAQSLQSQITGDLGGAVKMTRTSNTTVSLSARRSMSISYDPYIFCSIHLNAFNGSAHGTETWYYWSAGNSYNLATKVHNQMVAQLGLTNRGIKQNGWTVITGSSTIPAILTEALFVDNSTEWNMINTTSKDGFKKWVNGHLYGFYDHLKYVLGADVIDPRSSGGTVTPPQVDPTLTTSASELHFECYQGEHPTMTFSVKGENLSGNISVGSYAPGTFEPSVTSLPKEGGDVTVTFKNSDRIGNYNQDDNTTPYKIAVQCGSLRKEVKITALVKARPLNSMTEKWNLSEKRGTTTQKGYDASKIRNFCYKDGKLYCVYDHSEIKVLNAQTGEDLGNLNKGGICAGGVLTFCDVKTIDGRVVACNLATPGGELRIYAWDGDNANPYLLYTTTDFHNATRLGDCMELRGDWQNLDVTFANDDNTTTRIIEFSRSNGSDWSSKVIPVTTDGTTRLSTQGTTRAYSQVTGYWIDGKDSYPTWCVVENGTAVRKTYVDTGESWGSSHHEFQWGGEKHSVNIVFNGKQYNADGSMNNDENYKGARARIITDPTGDFTRMQHIADYPADGLGDVSRNTNATADAFVNTDGSTYAELWVHSTTHGIAYFAYGNPPTHNVNPIVPSSPTLAATPSSLNLTCAIGGTATGSINIEGSALKGDVSLSLSGTDASFFSLSTETITQSTGKGSVTVSYAPSAEGIHTATLTISSPEAEDVKVSLNGTATPQVTFIDEITADKLKEVWISSRNAGNKDWHDLETARSIAYNDGKLYVLHCKAWAAPAIKIIDAYSGEPLGDVNCSGVTSATIQIGDIAFMGGKLVASNVCTAAQNFRVYKWDNDNAAPEVLVSRDGDGVNGNIGGGALSVSGDLNNGRLWLTTEGSNSVVYFNVSGGASDSQPHEITLTDEDGKALATGVDGRGTGRVILNDDGTFWLTSMHSAPARFSADGKRIETMNPTALGYNSYGTAFTYFPFGSKQYAAAITYNFDKNCRNGHMALIDVTEGITAATEPIAVVPAQSFGENLNDQRISTICQSTRDDGTTLDLWASVYPQGIAHYSYVGRTSTGVESIATDDASAVIVRIEVYTISGALVHAENGYEIDTTSLPAGIYIIRSIDNRGQSTAKKVAIAR